MVLEDRVGVQRGRGNCLFRLSGGAGHGSGVGAASDTLWRVCDSHVTTLSAFMQGVAQVMIAAPRLMRPWVFRGWWLNWVGAGGAGWTVKERCREVRP